MPEAWTASLPAPACHSSPERHRRSSIPALATCTPGARTFAGMAGFPPVFEPGGVSLVFEPEGLVPPAQAAGLGPNHAPQAGPEGAVHAPPARVRRDAASVPHECLLQPFACDPGKVADLLARRRLDRAQPAHHKTGQKCRHRPRPATSPYSWPRPGHGRPTEPSVSAGNMVESLACKSDGRAPGGPFRPQTPRPLAMAGIVENGLVRPPNPSVKLPEDAHAIIVPSGEPRPKHTPAPLGRRRGPWPQGTYRGLARLHTLQFGRLPRNVIAGRELMPRLPPSVHSSFEILNATGPLGENAHLPYSSPILPEKPVIGCQNYPSQGSGACNFRL